MMTRCPTLTTERLTLRPHQMSDFEPMAQALGSDHARFVGGPMGERDAWSDLCRSVAQWHLLGHGAFAIDETQTKTFLGQISCSQHPYFAEPELGWTLLPAAQGKNVAFEAAKTVRAWVYDNTKISSLVSYIHQDNERSRRLAERLSAVLDENAPPAPYENHVVYRHPARGTLA